MLIRLYPMQLYPKCKQTVFWIQSDVNILDTVALNTVELASDCIQQLKHKLKLKCKQRSMNDNATIPSNNSALVTDI